MDTAREWLDRGKLLKKDAPQNPQDLENFDNVVDIALDYLQNIQSEIALVSKKENNDIVHVAVDDIKVLSVLAQLVVVYALYPNVPQDSLVPNLVKWPVNSYNNDVIKSSSIDRLNSYASKLAKILEADDDVSRLLLISSDFILCGFIAILSFEKDKLYQVLGMLPTAKLYTALVPLRSVSNPLHNVVEIIAKLPIIRSNAVFALIELVLEKASKGQDAVNKELETTALILVSVPTEYAKRDYVQKLGIQLLQVITSDNKEIVDAAAVFISVISCKQPKFVGHLRDLIVNPLIKSQPGAGQSLRCIQNLCDNNASKHLSFTSHISTRVLPSAWLLVCTTNDNKTYLQPFLSLVAGLLNCNPDHILLIVNNLLITKLPSNLYWQIPDGKEPILETILGRNSQKKPDAMELINERLDALILVLGIISDETATEVLLTLLQEYVGKSAESKSFVRQLILVKTIERVISDSNVRSKVFGNVQEVLGFTFSLVGSKVEAMLKKKLETSLNGPGVLNIVDTPIDSDGDSDDEDEETENAEGLEEDNAMLALLLALLGAALMEALGNQDLNLNVEDVASEAQKHSLEIIESNRHKEFSIEVLEKAQFCINILNGGGDGQNEPVDSNDPVAVLKEATQALGEPLPASQAYGMHLITKLVQTQHITLKTAMEIFTRKLGEEDSFIYLNAIKGIEATAKVYNTTEVITELTNYTKSSQKSINLALRAREAFLRILTPGSIAQVDASVINSFIEDLRAKSRDKIDIRFRMSSAALLGIIVAQFPKSITDTQQRELVDCALGILRFEKSDNEQFLRRSAVILVLEIVNAINQDDFKAVSMENISPMLNEIKSIHDSTTDATIRDHCEEVIRAIEGIH